MLCVGIGNQVSLIVVSKQTSQSKIYVKRSEKKQNKIAKKTKKTPLLLVKKIQNEAFCCVRTPKPEETFL